MMKRALLTAAALAAGGLVSTGALAQGYVGLSAGQSKAHFDCPAASSCDTTDTGYKIFGGVMVNQNFGAELSYIDFGKFKSTAIGDGGITGDARVDGVGLYGVAVAPFGQASVFGKLGIGYVHTKETGGTSNNKTDIAYGLGAGYDFTKNVGVRLEWDRMRGKGTVDTTTQTKDVDLLSLGVLYRF